MRLLKEAKKFAKTFISIVGIEDAPKALAELAVIKSSMLSSREFKNFLLNPGFSQTERESILKQIAEKVELSEKSLKFLIHLCERRVIAALPEIIKSATAIYLEKKRRAKATVLTPVEMSRSHEERLRASLKKLTEKDVDIEFIVEPSLLGGVLVKVGSTMYDSSIKGQLRLLKDELIKG